jgi:hypothetical protein
MKRGEKTYLIICGLLIVGLMVLFGNAPKPIDWSPNLSRHSRSPYGTALVYERLKDLFTQDVKPVGRTIWETGQQAEEREGPVTHMILETYFSPSELDLQALLEQASNGDHVFIVATALSGALDTALQLTSQQSYGFSESLTLRFLQLPGERRGFTMEKTEYSGSFTKLSKRCNILAVNGSSEAVFVHVPYGEGAFWLCSVPLAFTNYHLLKEPNDAFMSTVLSYLPDQPILWNEHNAIVAAHRDTPLSWLLSNTATTWALYLTFGLLILYMIFRSKREQRAVPVVEPLRNGTREFVGTVGNLYFAKGDHGDLARKMITYFKEEIRQRTYLRQFTYDTATYAHLSTKLGLSLEETTRRFNSLAALEKLGPLTEQQLLALNQELGALRARL